jgi:hypothetical protein
VKKTFVAPAIVVLTAAFSAACSSSHIQRADIDAEPEPAALYRLDRAGFVQELVFARATPRTLRFDAYTSGSYQVTKLDLLDGIRERRRNGTPIVAVVIRGPVGPMWAYQVDLFLRENDGVRVNTVWMPHARITYKATNLLTRLAFERLIVTANESPALVRGIPQATQPPSDSTEHPELDFDWSFDLLVATWIDDDEAIFHASSANSSEDAWACLNDTLDEATMSGVVTYAGDVSDDGESVYREIAKP